MTEPDTTRRTAGRGRRRDVISSSAAVASATLGLAILLGAAGTTTAPAAASEQVAAATATDEPTSAASAGAASTAPASTGQPAAPAPTTTATSQPSGTPTSPTPPTTGPTTTPTTAPTTSPTTTPPETDEIFTVDDAVLRWGVNDEANNRAFAPGTFNFLAAGKVPDPGRGGQTIVDRKWKHNGRTAWRQRAGEVEIEKVTSAGVVDATWAGLSTGPDGQPIPSTSSGIFSNHQVVISGGEGTVDPEAGTATVRWTGSFSVVYYSGMSFFTLSNPVLTVTPKSAKITATAAGYASSMTDQSKWSAVAPATVTLANLRRADLRSTTGFTSALAYLGVRYDSADSPQVRTGDWWGSFPTTFVRYLERLGSGAYWFSSGGAADRHKLPHPVSISWDATTQVEPETPEPSTTPTETPTNSVAPTPPTFPSAPTDVQPQQQRVGPGLPMTTSLLPTDATFPVGAYQPPTSYALTSSPATTDPSSDSPWEWLLGALLLLGAAGLTVSTQLLNRSKG
ncbi:hypothetical protein FXB39_06155 [Nocardioides sp. BGMRC 2183]|nr:hypothetical protein FXB39_06155 [Nocardioides sp. BGMRC 2183]